MRLVIFPVRLSPKMPSRQGRFNMGGTLYPESIFWLSVRFVTRVSLHQIFRVVLGE